MTSRHPLPTAGAGAAMQPPGAGERDGERHAPSIRASLPNCADAPAIGRAFSLGRIATYVVIAARACPRCACDFVPHRQGQRICAPCTTEARSGALMRRHGACSRSVQPKDGA